MKYLFIVVCFFWTTCGICSEHSEASRSTIEGTLAHVSKLPTPENNAYPDCYYTATIAVDQILSGPSIPKKVILVVPGFFSRQYAPEAHLRVGDKVRATVVPFASMPEQVRQAQQADEIEDVDLEFFFPKEISKISVFSKSSRTTSFKSNIPQSTKSATASPVDHKAQAARQETMRRDLKQINQLLAKHGGDWDQWYATLAEFRSKYSIEYEKKSSKWIADSYFSAGQLPHSQGYVPEFVQSIINFKNYLAARNVDLIVVRFPYKGELADDLFAPLPQDGISNPYILRMYKELLEADVEVLADIIPRAKKSRLDYPLMYWYQDFTEPHPADGMVWVVAEALAERLRRYDKVLAEKKEKFGTKKMTAAIMSRPASKFSVWPNNVFWPVGNPKFNPEEYVAFSGITTEKGTTLYQKEGLDSPVLVVGSSFIRYPSWELGATLSNYLAYLIGTTPDTLSRLGADQSIPRTIAREGDNFLKNRVVCIFPIVPWAFYGALDSPPIISPDRLKKTLLSSIAGSELKKQVRIKPETPEYVFSFSSNGTLDIAARDITSRSGLAGTFEVSLPKQASDYPYVVVEIESKLGDASAFSIKYGDQSIKVQKFYSQKNENDAFIFESRPETHLEVSVDHIEPGFQTSIQALRVYGASK